MFALVDGNNFYASCERFFDPKLEKCPVIVLSNNDGCVIARSNEVKAFGITMGTPYHEVKPFIRNNGIKVFSSNYTLYGDMSARMMDTLHDFSPDVEIYSIDECFPSLAGFHKYDLYQYGQTIRHTVRQYVGIPCCVGIGPTKTLAKVANKLVKKLPTANGVYLINEANRQEALERINIDDIWSVEIQSQKKLFSEGVTTGWELSQVPRSWAKQYLGGHCRTEIDR